MTPTARCEPRRDDANPQMRLLQSGVGSTALLDGIRLSLKARRGGRQQFGKFIWKIISSKRYGEWSPIGLWHHDIRKGSQFLGDQTIDLNEEFAKRAPEDNLVPVTFKIHMHGSKHGG